MCQNEEWDFLHIFGTSQKTSTLMDRSKSLTDETGVVIQPPIFSRKRNKTFYLNKTPFTVCNSDFVIKSFWN